MIRRMRWLAVTAAGVAELYVGLQGSRSLTNLVLLCDIDISATITLAYVYQITLIMLCGFVHQVTSVGAGSIAAWDGYRV